MDSRLYVEILVVKSRAREGRHLHHTNDRPRGTGSPGEWPGGDRGLPTGRLHHEPALVVFAEAGSRTAPRTQATDSGDWTGQ